MRWCLRCRWVLILLALGWELVQSAPLPATQETLQLPEVVAEVNGEPITSSQWVAALVQRSGQRVLDQLIDERLVEQALRESGIEVPAAEVDARLAEIKEGVGGEADFRDWLASQGTDPASFRRWIELDLGVEELVRPQVKVTAEDVQWRYLQEGRRITLYHIFVKTQEEADRYRQQVVSRQIDFPTLVRNLAPDSALVSQRAPVFNYDALPPEFADVAFRMQAGEVSEPIKSEYGYYLLYVSKVEDPPPATDADRARIEKDIFRQRLNETKANWLQEARQRARIERRWPAGSSPPAGQ